jgi:hypothetical protein
VPQLLDLFERYGVHATWAMVGFLFFDSREALLAGVPGVKPAYRNPRLDPYRDLERIGEDERADPFHFAPSLIRLVQQTPHQEVGTHTFSHFYCLEEGQTADAFRADLLAAKAAAETFRITLRSLVFPRNQFNERYLSVCDEVGIRAFRGNQESWMYSPANGDEESWPRRGARLLDSYVNVSGVQCRSLAQIQSTTPRDASASRFLRPYSRRLRSLEPLRLKRILAELEYAAKMDLVYHLWWHPHNFGLDTDENLRFLTSILKHFSRMRDLHGMHSLNMGEIADW